MKFGDLICYRGGESHHDAPLMLIGPCGHREGRNAKGEMTGLVDILDLHLRGYGIHGTNIEHKDPNMWQPCAHYESAR